MSDTSSAQGPGTAIDDFSQCHTGIFKKLDMLAELPALLEPAARAREVAGNAVEFFREAIFEHHLDEERELFPVVLGHAQKGDEFNQVKAMVERLTHEHRELEAVWKRLESSLKTVAKGHASDVRVSDIDLLVQHYRTHAEFEEQQFLPLAQTVLGRNSNVMAALGLSLHMRHAPTKVTNYI